MTKSKVLNIDGELSSAQFAVAADIWDANSDCAVELALDMATADIERVSEIALKLLPRKLALVVLCDLVELEATPAKVLEEVFNTGDQACIESVCLRGNLPPLLNSKCELLRKSGLVHHRLPAYKNG